MNLNGNNYQIIGVWKGGAGYTLFGYAETRKGAEELIDDLSKREDCTHICKWRILDRKSGEAEDYEPAKEGK